MWKKAFIRSTCIGLVVMAVVAVFATTHGSKVSAIEDCTSTGKEEGCEKKTQADFIIWESLSRTVMANIQY